MVVIVNYTKDEKKRDDDETSFKGTRRGYSW